MSKDEDLFKSDGLIMRSRRNKNHVINSIDEIAKHYGIDPNKLSDGGVQYGCIIIDDSIDEEISEEKKAEFYNWLKEYNKKNTL